MKILLNILIITIISFNLSLAEELQVFNFTETELTELKVRKVRGADNKTLYTVGTNDNGNYLKSVADNAASGLGQKLHYQQPISNNFRYHLFQRYKVFYCQPLLPF